MIIEWKVSYDVFQEMRVSRIKVMIGSDDADGLRDNVGEEC
jgi:hypothetical protein